MQSRFQLFTIILLNLSSAYATEKAISDKVLKDYNNRIRPSRNTSESIKVSISADLYSITEIVEARETLEFVVWLSMTWKDDYLTWNPNEFDGIKSIRIPVDSLWYPDLIITNMLESRETLPPNLNFAEVSSTGKVRAWFWQNMKVHCAYDVTLYPFDTQNCSIIYGSWAYSQRELDLFPEPITDSSKFFMGNTEWELISYEATREIKDYSGDQPDVNYHIVIKRRPLPYVISILMPTFVIAFLSFVGLFSPFNSSGERQEKVTLGLTTLLTLSVMLLMVDQKMPKSSTGMPLMGLFIMFELMMSSLAILIAVCIMYVHRSGLARPVPLWLLKLTCLKAKTWPIEDQLKEDLNGNITEGQEKPVIKLLKSHMDEIKQMLLRNEMINESKELWSQACGRLDLIALISFIVINIVVTIVIFSI